MADEKKSRFIFKEPATPLSAKQLIDQTLCTTPVPQAASTANRDANNVLTPMPSSAINIQPPEDKYISNLLKEIETMREQVQKQVNQKYSEGRIIKDSDKIRQSVESDANSSLGILKQDDLKGLEGIDDSFIFCESEMNKDLSQRFEKELERYSLGLKKFEQEKEMCLPTIINDNDKVTSGLQKDVLPGLEDFSCSKGKESVEEWIQNTTLGLQLRRSNSGHSLKSMEIPKFNSDNKYSPESIANQRQTYNAVNPFTGFDKIRISSDDEFVSGDAMEIRLLEDEKAWAQEMIPLNSQRMSLSGILESDKSISDQGKDKLSMSSFMRQGSCPLGNRGGDNCRQEQRPAFGRLIKSPIKTNPPFAIMPPIEGKRPTFELDEVPTKDTNVFHHEPLQHTCNEEDYDEDGLSSSDVSSVASVSQIAELLSNMSSDATPRTLVNKIMSKAKSRKHLTPISEDNKSGEKKYTNDFQNSFPELCNNFKKKSFVVKEEQENICPTSPLKSISVSEGSNKEKVVRPLQLKEQYNCTGGNNDNHTTTHSSVCESEKSTRYSSSINSSLDLSGLSNMSNDINNEMWMKMFKKQISKPDSLSSRSSTIKSNNTVIIDDDDEQVSSTTREDQVSLSVQNEGDSSELNICVGSSVSMDFDLFNETNNVQICTITKHAYVNDMVSTDAAIIKVINNQLILEPHSSKTIPVTITPFVAEAITVKLEVRREDIITKEVILDSVSGKIIGELPDIKVMSDYIISFDPIHEGCATHQYIKLYNAGKCEVPATLKISKSSHTNSMFSFDGREMVNISINPGEVFKQRIDCFGVAVEALTKMNASVEVTITDDDNYDSTNLLEILSIPISAVISPCRLNIDERELILQVGVKNIVSIQNCSPITMKMSLIPPAGVVVQTTELKLDPGQKYSLFVSFDSKNIKGDVREGSSVAIQIIPNGKTYELMLKTRQGSYPPTVSSISVLTPQSSRAASPMSPSSSVASADGNMQLECTHTTLVWASYPVHSKIQKTCMLRNRSMHREKLLISLSGSNNCFKLLKDKNKLVDQLQLSLQPMESTSLTVVMVPTHAGAFTSSLCITRINSSIEKKVLPLYGYGGKAKLIPQSVSRDPDQRMWIYLDSNTLSTSFILKNMGDATAFVKISQGMEAMGISISPPECLILPGAYISVEISLTTTADRLEYLLSQPGDSAVSVTKLTLTLGDESTRHRLNRLRRKLQATEQGIDTLWNSRLMVLNGLFSDKDMEDVRVLRDPVTSLETLWQEGIREWTIGVLVERTLLETMQLDSSVEYLDLENTILEETVYTLPPLQYNVTPRTLTLSSEDCNQELTLENMTLNAVPFECESTAGLHMTLSKGVISAISSVKIFVSWIEPVMPTLECRIKVTFNNKEKIEVPVLFKTNTNPTLVVENGLPTNLGIYSDTLVVRNGLPTKPGVYSDEYNVVFPATTVGGKSMCRVRIFNPDKATALVRLEEITGPFTLGTPEFILKGLWYINLRVVFRPTTTGGHEGTLILNINNENKLTYELYGKGVMV